MAANLEPVDLDLKSSTTRVAVIAMSVPAVSPLNAIEKSINIAKPSSDVAMRLSDKGEAYKFGQYMTVLQCGPLCEQDLGHR